MHIYIYIYICIYVKKIDETNQTKEGSVHISGAAVHDLTSSGIPHLVYKCDIKPTMYA
jgi:hypothetical protein